MSHMRNPMPKNQNAGVRQKAPLDGFPQTGKQRAAGDQTRRQQQEPADPRIEPRDGDESRHALVRAVRAASFSASARRERRRFLLPPVGGEFRERLAGTAGHGSPA